MGWFIGERRGVSWRDQTLESLSAPPLALIVLFGLVIFLMSMSTYSEYKATVEKSKASMKLMSFLLPFLIILLVYIMIDSNRWFYPYGGVTRPVVYHLASQEGGSPWGIALLLVLLLVMVHYQDSFQSTWFRIL
ncbi:hypothetical protein H5410_024758 [Solanum commersonii]|uniref:Uncharacterized protein n=1 Tax=Solanum commersonii TaxID=4109 RepID=A0A9J5ZMT8_SOLCO|nr:hypothetical protein H5410_024758 [Solanum commersonii]